MKKTGKFCLFLCVLLLLCCIAPGVQATQNTVADQSITSGTHSVDAAVALSDEGKLLKTAKTVILYERNSDTMIYTHNPDQRIYPSSMVKLMTTLVALEKGNLSDRVTVTKTALSHLAIQYVSAGLKPGEELTLEDLLYCVMTQSANDACLVVAEHIGGSQEGFLLMMNEMAEKLGCLDTHYSNVHGLHDKQTYTTGRDICRILDYALDIPAFKAMFCAPTYTVPATNMSQERVLHTTNHMISRETIKKYFDERVTGGKTGYTEAAGRCLAVTAEGEGMELLAIVMGAKHTYEADGVSLATFGSFEEMDELLDHTFENYTYRQIFYDGQVVAQFPVIGGANHVVVQPTRPAAAVLPKDLNDEELIWSYDQDVGAIHAPVADGQPISALQIWYGSKCIAQTDLVAIHGVAQEQYIPPYVRTEPDNGGGSWIILLIVCAVILGIAALFFAGVRLRRFFRRMQRNIRRRRRREERRRSR